MSQRSRPLIANQHLALALGLGGFVAGWIFLHDAYDGRGMAQPKLLRPFTWW